MPTLDQRVTSLELASERNTDFVNEKLVEHAVRLDRIEFKVDKLALDVAAIKGDVATLKSDVAGLKSGVDALPAVIAQIIRDEFAARDRKSAS